MAMAGAAVTAVTAVGLLYGASSASAAAQYNAQMGFRDAQIARQNAQDSAKQSARETYLRTGSMVASHSASGGRDGSFLDVLGDAAAQGELERQHIIYAGSVASDRLAHGAGLSEAQAGSELVGGGLRASGALLGGAGKNSGGATVPNYSNYGASPEE